MSLESQIAALVTATNNLTEEVVGGKIEEIEATLEAGMANLPNAMQKTLFVDPVSGNDENGGSFAAPLKTIKKACDLGPLEGLLNISVLGAENEAYTFQASEINISPRSVLNIRPFDRVTGLERHGKLVFPWMLSEGVYYLPKFYLGSNTQNTIMLARFDIDIPAAPSSGTLADATFLGVFSGSAANKRAVFNFNFTDGHIRNLAPTVAYLFAGTNRIVNFQYSLMTHEGMPGRWFYGVPAGTHPKDTGRIMSNLTSL